MSAAYAFFSLSRSGLVDLPLRKHRLAPLRSRGWPARDGDHFGDLSPFLCGHASALIVVLELPTSSKEAYKMRPLLR